MGGSSIHVYEARYQGFTLFSLLSVVYKGWINQNHSKLITQFMIQMLDYDIKKLIIWQLLLHGDDLEENGIEEVSSLAYGCQIPYSTYTFILFSLEKNQT